MFFWFGTIITLSFFEAISRLVGFGPSDQRNRLAAPPDWTAVEPKPEEPGEQARRRAERGPREVAPVSQHAAGSEGQATVVELRPKTRKRVSKSARPGRAPRGLARVSQDAAGSDGQATVVELPPKPKKRATKSPRRRRAA